MIMKSIRFIFLILIFLLLSYSSYSQCSMCKAVAEESIKNNESTLAKGLNKGILYLLFFPYAIVGVLIYILFKKKLYK